MAKRFQFRLEQVLSLRKQVEEARVRELALAKGRLLEIEEEIKVHRETEAEFLGAFAEMEKKGSFNTEQVMAYSDYKSSLTRKEKMIRNREREWAQEVERRRGEAVKASKQRQLLDNLKEKQQRAHDLEVVGEEQKFLDELSSIAFIRRERAQKAVNADTNSHLRR